MKLFAKVSLIERMNNQIKMMKHDNREPDCFVLTTKEWEQLKRESSRLTPYQMQLTDKPTHIDVFKNDGKPVIVYKVDGSFMAHDIYVLDSETTDGVTRA